MGFSEDTCWSIAFIILLVVVCYRYKNGMEFNPVKYIKVTIASIKVSRELAIEQEKAYQQHKVDTLEKIRGENK
tara:strand:- start:93 stop:314 length:222 start_codon:yes stop_codon:yes gene_type:complete